MSPRAAWLELFDPIPVAGVPRRRLLTSQPVRHALGPSVIGIIIIICTLPRAYVQYARHDDRPTDQPTDRPTSLVSSLSMRSCTVEGAKERGEPEALVCSVMSLTSLKK